MDTFRGRSRFPFYFHPPELPETNPIPSTLPLTFSQDFSEIPRRVGLQDLPTEIILCILDELDDEHVFAFAFLSKSLHHLSLRLYLSRKGFGSHPEGQLSLFNYNALDCLKALRVSLFQPKLRKLLYAIDCRKSEEELSDEFKLVKMVLGKLREVQEMEISFQDVPNPGLGPSPILSPSYFGSRPEDVQIRETTTLYGLSPALCLQLTGILDSLINGGKCSSISLGNCFLHAPSSEEIQAVMLHYFGGARGWAEYLMKSFHQWTRRPIASQRSGLRMFKLHSRMVFHPHLCHWTIQRLNESHLTTLSIAHHYMMDNATWAMILPHIYVPTLTAIFIDSSSISPQDLLRFLHKHSALQTLYIGRHVPGPDASLQSGRPYALRPLSSLRQLTHLISPPDWVAHFLEHKMSLPSLQNVKILLHFQSSQQFTLSTCDETLEPAVQRLVELDQVQLALTFGSPVMDWKSSAPWPQNTDVNSPLLPHTLITHLEIYTRTYNVPLLAVVKIPRWLASQSLDALQQLTLVQPADSPDSEVWTSFTPSQKEILVRNIGDSCPGVTIDFKQLDQDAEFPVLFGI